MALRQIAATGSIAVPLSNTATADSYGLGVSTSGAGTMKDANFFDALPMQIRGRTASQAISSGGGAGISITTNYVDSLSHQIIVKHKTNGSAVYQLLPVPRSKEPDIFALNLMKSPLVDNALRHSLTIMGGGDPCNIINKAVNFYN